MRTCLNCSRPLVGRPDKKFCHRKCRMAYHHRARQARLRLAAPSGAREPRPDAEMISRDQIFRDHNCSRCHDGVNLSRCPTPDRPGNCGFPHARND